MQYLKNRLLFVLSTEFLEEVNTNETDEKTIVTNVTLISHNIYIKPIWLKTPDRLCNASDSFVKMEQFNTKQGGSKFE